MAALFEVVEKCKSSQTKPVLSSANESFPLFDCFSLGPQLVHPTFLAHNLSLLCWFTGKIIKDSMVDPSTSIPFFSYRVIYTVFIATSIIGFTLAPMVLYGEFLTRVPNKSIFCFLICQADPVIVRLTPIGDL